MCRSIAGTKSGTISRLVPLLLATAALPATVLMNPEALPAPVVGIMRFIVSCAVASGGGQ
jgi:hypothetical protein